MQIQPDPTTDLTIQDLEEKMLAEGEQWAISHAYRLAHLTEDIGAGLDYDCQALCIAIFLHDWGAFPRYAQKGVDHAYRSRQVAEAEILPRMGLLQTQQVKILDAIELHDYRDQRPVTCTEALLLREADMLEFLGMIGLAREFARGPKDLPMCYQRVVSRRDEIVGKFSLPRSQQIAQLRLERMAKCLAWLDEESGGIL